MSLLDALLQDPHKHPKDVWIALRTDGNKGSGTAEDPYHGGVKLEESKALSNLTHSGTTATAAFGNAHGYDLADIVTISGALVGGELSVHYNGRFAIRSKTDTTITYEMTGDPGSDADATSTTSQRNILLFDEVMKGLDAAGLNDVAIHIGPGEFLTRGDTGEGAPLELLMIGITEPLGWQIREGWNIVGSGIDITVLKFVGLFDTSRALHNAIGTKAFALLADYAQVSDLTVDCNMGENPGGVVGAVRIRGNHVRIRRVRAVNFGTEFDGTSPPTKECFVLAVGGGHGLFPAVSGGVIEGCILEQPWENNNEVTTGLIPFGAQNNSPNTRPTPPMRGMVFRNNYINFEFANGNLAEVESIEFRDETLTFTDIGVLTTKSPHRHILHKNLVLRGAANATTSNPFNGVFPIEEIVSDTVLKFRLPVTPTANPQGAMVIGKPVPSHVVRVTNIAEDSGNTYIITTGTPHQRTTKNKVRLFNVSVGGNPSNLFTTTTNHRVVAVLPPEAGQLESHKFKITLSGAIGAGSITFSNAYMHPAFQAFTIAGIGSMATGNRIVGCPTGGPYHDTFTHREEIIRGNYYHDILVGPRQHLGRLNTAKEGSVLVVDAQDLSKGIFTALEPHNLSTNDEVHISGAVTKVVDPVNSKVVSNSPTLSNAFNDGGLKTITKIDNYSFSFPLSSTPGSNAWSAPLCEKFVGGVGQGILIGASLEVSGTTATFRTLANHGFSTDDTVEISGIAEIKPDDSIATGSDTVYNGQKTITKEDDRTFTYSVSPAPNSDPFTSPMFKKDGTSDLKVGSPLIKDGTTATFSTVFPHQMVPGEAVQIQSALVNGSDVNPFNTTSEDIPDKITSVPTPTSFIYEMASEPSANAFGAPTYRLQHNVGRMLIENNIIELLQDREIPGLFPTGVRMDDAGATRDDPYVVLLTIIRNNVIRQLRGLMQSDPYAFDLTCVEKAIIENNIIELAREDAMRVFHTGDPIHFFNNRRLTGSVIRGTKRFDAGDPIKMPELARKIEDANLLAF